jgi:hypothetical protein
MYDKCPDSSDQLLNYLNNHNGGVLQNAVPTGKEHVVETGNNVHIRAVRLRLILLSKNIGAFLIESIGGFSPLHYTDY